MTPLRLVPFVAVLLGAQALANLDNAIVNVATPAMGRTLHAGGAALQLTVVAYVLVTALGIVLAIAAARVLPRDEAAPARVDLDPLGIAAFAAATIALVVPLTLGRELGWPAWALVSLIASASLAVAFVRWERRRSATGAQPVLNVALFDDPVMRSGLIALACVRITYFSLLFVLAQYLQTGRHESALISGLALAIWATGYGVAAPIYARASVPVARWFAPAGCAAMAAAFAALALAASARLDTPAVVMVALACGGFGFGCVSTSSMSLLTGFVAREHASDLSGVLSTMVPLTTVLGVALFGTLYFALAANPSSAFAIVCASFAIVASAGGAAATLALRGGLSRVTVA